jgi:ankyrin repeat protein
MSLRELPARPNLEHLKKQAKLLLRERLQADVGATERFEQARVRATPPKLADALHVIAREYGFDDWTSLKAKVAALSDNPMEVLSAAIKANDVTLLRQILKSHPELKLDEPLPDYGFDAPALIAAVHKKNLEMIDVLLDAGANINARTRWWAGGFGVLDSSDPELTRYLIERGAQVDVHAAARLGMFDRLKELIQADPDLVHARGGDGQTPLHFAANIEIAAYLLDHGADIDARDIDHESTPAQYMAGHWPRRPEVARYLISRGAQTDILMAAAVGDLERVQWHLDEDPASVRISVSEKDFPKQNPESGGCIYIFGFGWTRTAHMLAHKFGHHDIFRLLMQRSSIGLRFAISCEVGDEELARNLLTKHPGLIGKQPPDAYRRLIGAALRNNTKAVGMMLHAGWPVDVRSNNQQTALHWAAFHGNEQMVRVLIDYRAPLEAEEQQFKGTPLSWALYGSEHGWNRDTGDYAATVEALLAAGAKTSGPIDDLEAPEEVLEVMRKHAG